MAVLPASKAFPRGGAPRREYVKGAPLFAKMAMKFGGVEYPRGSELPIGQMSTHKHWELWMCGKADHVMAGPFDRKIDVPVEAPAPAQAEVPAEAALTDVELEKLTAPTSSPAAPEAPVEAPTPTKRKR